MTENAISTCGQETYIAFRARIVHISRGFCGHITDLPDDNRIYEVTSLTNSNSIAVTSYIQENADPFFV